MSKEQIYDELISPLMAQVIAICNEHKIANVLTFSLDNEGDGLCCTTCNLREDTDPPEHFRRLVEIIFPERRNPMMLTVEHGDGTKTVSAFLD